MNNPQPYSITKTTRQFTTLHHPALHQRSKFRPPGRIPSADTLFNPLDENVILVCFHFHGTLDNRSGMEKKVKNCIPKTGKWMVILQLNITRLFIHASIKPAPEQLMVNNEQQIFFQD